MRGRICKQRTAAFRRIVPSGQRFRQVSELRDVSITGFTALIDGGEDYNPELHHFVVWGCARTTSHRTAPRRPGSWRRSAHGIHCGALTEQRHFALLSRPMRPAGSCPERTGAVGTASEREALPLCGCTATTPRTAAVARATSSLAGRLVRGAVTQPPAQSLCCAD
jgi:hypothetical protein